MSNFLHFCKAMWDWAWSGFILLPSYMIELRHTVCKECDEYRRGWFRTYCDRCKCTVTLGRHPLNKLAYPCEQCPDNKWSKCGGYECDE